MKRLIAFTAFLVAAFAAAAAHAGVKIQHWVAPSGARVYLVETHGLPILDVKVDFSAGAAYDPPGKSGLAGLTRDLLDAGAGGMDEETLAGKFVDLGARFSGGDDYDRAGVSLRTLSAPDKRDAGMNLLRAILAQPAFPAAAFEREKARSIAEIQESDTKPEAIAGKRFAAAIYPGHPYGLTPTAPSVGSITRDDVVAFHRDHYSAKRAVVSMVGDISRGDAEALAQRLTEALPAGVPDAGIPPVTSPTETVIRVPHPASQSHIHVGLPALKRGDPDFYALQAGNYSLGGGGFVSRLMKEVREKRGYAYSVYSYFSPRKQEGPFEMGLQTKREQADAALKLADDVLADFLANGPTEQELAAAKKHLIDSLALAIDSNAKLIGYVSIIGYYGLPLTYLDDFPAKMQAVTVADVRAAFKRHVDPKHLVTVVVATDQK
ncbi:MAG TPA: pitrilysin family protein [Rhodocyclaceae bacterium]